MLKYIISTFLFICCFIGYGQENNSQAAIDSVAYKQTYGLRVGVDLSRPLRGFLTEGYSGLELVGDYRLSFKLYLAGELGNEQRTKQEDLYNFNTSGSYIKLGVDFNTYDNWYGEQNMIYFGGRYAFSTFSQTLNNYQIFDSNRYWSPDGFAEGSSEPIKFEGLNASWLELVAGIKAELFARIYLSSSVRLGFLLTNKDPENFKNLFIPGFNRVTDGARFGVGYNFTLSYLIPIYKKTKTLKKVTPETKVLEEEN